MSTSAPLFNAPVEITIPAQQIVVPLPGGGAVAVEVPKQTVLTVASIPLAELATALAPFFVPSGGP